MKRIRPYSYTTQIVSFRRPIIINHHHPEHTKGIDAACAQFGLQVEDFVWITAYKTWPQKIGGLSRSTLVVDPYGMLHDGENQRFALGIRGAFDHIVSCDRCAPVLCEWLRRYNPPLHSRMLAALPTPPARNGPSLEQQEQQPFDPERDWFPASITLGLPNAAAEHVTGRLTGDSQT